MDSKKLSELEVFAENVRYLRIRNGCTKKAMAEIMGIGIVGLNKLENGIIPKSIGIINVYNVSKHFNISISSLFTEIQKQSVPI